MSISTYTELKTAIANFLARTDLTDQIPNFIQLAEARLSRELETRDQEKRANATLTVGDEFIALPTDLREVREVKLNTSPNTVLDYKSPIQLDKDFPSGGNGKPLSYSIVGAEMKLRPVPDSAYTAEIIYIGGLTALSDSNATNQLLTRHPDAYLSGSLVEAYTYLMDEARASTYDAKFTRSIEEIRKDEQRSHYGTGSLHISSVYARQSSSAS
jgi:hypothetical protein|tara:strand:+ start:1094 stop:1735 length:642 start_codon:yes stop_codon:yes gene_type:complete